MHRLCLATFCVAAAAAPAFGQAPDWSHAQRAEVTLANFSFTPRTIRLHAGQPVILHLVNASGGGHDFTAPAFFAAAQLRPADRAAVAGGSIELSGHQTRDIALVPKAGRYRLKCGHTFHKTFGMAGEIVVQ
jgi:uncharacterized cupredoxin-like copper-binding protein